MALIVGCDLGRKSAHDVVILRRETAQQVGRAFRFTSTPEGVDELFGQIRKVRQNNEPVAFVIDSPGKAWVPVTAAIKARGFDVYRPTGLRFSKMRQAGDRKNKTNRIDAMALARCLLNFPQDTQHVFLPYCVLARMRRLRQKRRTPRHLVAGIAQQARKPLNTQA